MFRAYEVCRLWGVPLRVSPSLALVWAPIAFFTWGIVGSVIPQADRGITLTLALLSPVVYVCSILLHELGHLAILRYHGVPVESLTLNGWGGRLRVPAKTLTPEVDGAVAAAGPAVTLVLACVGLACAVAGRETGDGVAEGVALTLVLLNVCLLPGCLIPVRPTDSYRMVRALIWKVCGDEAAGTRAASSLSLAVVALLLGMGMLCLRAQAGGGSMLGLSLLGVGAIFLPQSSRMVGELRSTPVAVTVGR